MDTTIYTPEVMAQAGQIYDRLGRFPTDEQAIAAAIAEAFINGMSTKERLLAEQTARERAGT